MNPTTLPLQKYLIALHEKYRGLTDGAVADYIPELAKADPDSFGICIVTADGYAYEVGDCAREFTMQSLSKPAVYAAALADQGAVPRADGQPPSRHQPGQEQLAQGSDGGLQGSVGGGR